MSSPVLVVSDPDTGRHAVPDHHPDAAGRVDAVLRGIHRVADPEASPGRPATAGELEVVHDPDHVTSIRSQCEAGGGWIDRNTFLASGTYEAARRAAGAGLAAVEALDADSSLRAAFAVTRPPGHHAAVDRAMGFCVFNNVAVAAGHLVRRGQRVVIVDWDAHHGNGTQSIFWHENRVLYISVHQEPLFPGTGYPHERGPDGQHLTTVNLPLPPGATGDHHLELLRDPCDRMVASFDPDWVLVSCGFDAHRDDPLADMALGAGDFALLASHVLAWAPQPGRTLFILEGGYALTAIEDSSAAVLSVLHAGTAGSFRPTTGGPGADRVASLRRFFAPA